MFDPISAAIGLIIGTVIATNPGQLPTCEEVKASNPAVYKMQTQETTGARPMKTCRD